MQLMDKLPGPSVTNYQKMMGVCPSRLLHQQGTMNRCNIQCLCDSPKVAMMQQEMGPFLFLFLRLRESNKV